jgi:hypothetical protein
LLVAVRNDPVFGPTIVCGFGGLYTELVDDIAVRLAPVSEAEAIDMLQELRLFSLLDGARDQRRFDVGAAARTVSGISKLLPLLPEDVIEVEVNPLIVLESGSGCKAVDLLVVRTAADSQRAADYVKAVAADADGMVE